MKCLNENCDYMKFIYISEEDEELCPFSEGAIHKCLFNISEIDDFTILDTPQMQHSHVEKGVDIMQILKLDDRDIVN